MNSISRLVATTVLASVLPGAALAADYDPPIIVDEIVDDYVPVEIGTGWYLRGDIGYSVTHSHDGPFRLRIFDIPTATYDTYDYTSGGIDNPLSFGGGFGYRFTDYLRADLTFDIFTSEFGGTTATANPCVDATLAPALFGTTCRSEDTASLLGVTMLANGYVDLGTYVGFTPYVGGGAGATYVKWDDVTRTNYCVGGACPVGFTNETTHAGARDLRFTWAAMAGVAYDVSDNMKLDLGYRYSRIAGGSMYEFDTISFQNGANGVQATDPGRSSHEVRVGLRYELW
jgi:opacity protein-like surface antigen